MLRGKEFIISYFTITNTHISWEIFSQVVPSKTKIFLIDTFLHSFFEGIALLQCFHISLGNVDLASAACDYIKRTGFTSNSYQWTAARTMLTNYEGDQWRQRGDGCRSVIWNQLLLRADLYQQQHGPGQGTMLRLQPINGLFLIRIASVVKQR